MPYDPEPDFYNPDEWRAVSTKEKEDFAKLYEEIHLSNSGRLTNGWRSNSLSAPIRKCKT